MLRSLRATLLPCSHSLLRRSPISGTAKGKPKGKDKSAAPLKRSVIPKKKSSGAAAATSRASSAPNELTRMAESCLAAPAPLRRLSPNDLRREAERARLGLLSPASAARAASPPPAEPFPMGTPGLDYVSLGLVDADEIPAYELTAEDGQRLAKECSRVLMRRHRARQAAETGILRLRKEAIAALPARLREAAMVPDFAPFPADRFMATLTPPIEGYIEKVKEAARRSVGKEKLR